MYDRAWLVIISYLFEYEVAVHVIEETVKGVTRGILALAANLAGLE